MEADDEYIQELQKAVKHAALIIYSNQEMYELSDNTCLEAAPIIESVIIGGDLLCEHIIKLAAGRKQIHKSWVRAIENALILNKFTIGMSIARITDPDTLNMYRNGRDTLWFPIMEFCDLNMVKEFIHFGLNPRIQGLRAWTAKHYAVWFKRKDILSYLITECGENEDMVCDEIGDCSILKAIDAVSDNDDLIGCVLEINK